MRPPGRSHFDSIRGDLALQIRKEIRPLRGPGADDCLVFPEHALAGARCIHEDFIEETREDVCKACRCLIGDKHVFASEQLQIAQQCFGAGVADVIGDEKAGSFQARTSRSVALPPGAAQRSSTRSPGSIGRRDAGVMALGSCR